MIVIDFSNDPKLIDEVMHLRADFSASLRQIESLKEMNEFLRQIIISLISNAR